MERIEDSSANRRKFFELFSLSLSLFLSYSQNLIHKHWGTQNPFLYPFRSKIQSTSRLEKSSTRPISERIALPRWRAVSFNQAKLVVLLYGWPHAPLPLSFSLLFLLAIFSLFFFLSLVLSSTTYGCLQQTGFPFIFSVRLPLVPDTDCCPRVQSRCNYPPVYTGCPRFQQSETGTFEQIVSRFVLVI